MKTIPIAILGCDGRMGRALLECLTHHENLELTAAFAREDTAVVGIDAGACIGFEKKGVTVGVFSDQVNCSFNVMIDFTIPEQTLRHLNYCVENNIALVIGTTGFSDLQLSQIQEAAKHIPILLASNMSVGVNLCYQLLEKTAKVLGDKADIEIIEAHHRNKIDAPSGTALSMGEVISKALDRDVAEHAVYGRRGQTGERPRKEIGFSTIRGGDIVGDHTVIFACEGERIEITHKASSRATFANGALQAAEWIADKSPMLYDMQAVLRR